MRNKAGSQGNDDLRARIGTGTEMCTCTVCTGLLQSPRLLFPFKLHTEVGLVRSKAAWHITSSTGSGLIKINFNQ
jgi:hypothetical protein